MLGACNRCRASVWRSFCSLVTSSWSWHKRFTRSTKLGPWATCFSASSKNWASRRWFARPSVWKQAASANITKLMRARKALAAQGRSLLLSQGYRTKGSWWRPGAFSKLQAFIAEWISQELALWQANLELLDQQIAQLKTELAQSLQGPRPK